MKIISCLRCELDFQGQIAAAFDQTMKLTDGRIDVFINNAGIGIGGPIEFCKIEDVQKQMDVKAANTAERIANIHHISFTFIVCLISLPKIQWLRLTKDHFIERRCNLRVILYVSL